MKNELINKLLEYLESTKDFFLENVPPFFQEMIVYARISHMVYFLIKILFLVGGTIFIKKMYPQMKKEIGKVESILPTIICCIILLLLIILLSFMTSLDRDIMVWFAPKLYIIKHLK